MKFKQNTSSQNCILKSVIKDCTTFFYYLFFALNAIIPHLKEKHVFFKKYKICYSNVVTYQKINVLNEIEMLNIADNDYFFSFSMNFLRFQIRDGVAVTAFPHSIKIF